MNTIKQTLQSFTLSGALLSSVMPALSVEDLKLTIHCPDVVLSWPSVEWSGETYIVQYRETLDTNSSWLTLTNAMPPDSATNLTLFVHSNRVDCPAGQVFGMRSSVSGSTTLSAMTKLSVADRVSIKEAREAVRLVALFERCEQEGREPYEWELKNHPPLPPSPEEIRAKILKAKSARFGLSNKDGINTAELSTAVRLSDEAGFGDPSPECANGPSEPGCGFYRVVRTGVWLYGLTNGTALSGVIKLPVEAGYHQGKLNSVTINANGRQIEGTPVLSQPLPGMLSFQIDSRRLINGDYYFQATGMWLFDSTNEFDSALLQIHSPSVLVTISNQIMYPDWIPDFRDDLMLIKMTSAQTDVDWRVDIYGEAGDYVRSFTNHSADGVIDFAWNITGTNNNPRTDSFFTTVTTLSGSNSTSVVETNPFTFRVVDNYPAQGMWITARSSYIPNAVQNYALYTNVANYFALMGEAGGGVLPTPPQRNPGEILVLSKATGITNWGRMFRSFTNHNARNFYFDGHGGPDWIGYGWDNGEQKMMFPASVVAQALHNTVPGTNSVRYRWVWLDACSTALGVWPQTFGLGTRENVPLSSYTSRPGAFCGFSEPVYAYTAGINTIATSSINFRNWFVYFWWLDNKSLANAFGLAAFWSGYNDFVYLKVYGYWGLGWNSYNTKAEWPPVP